MVILKNYGQEESLEKVNSLGFVAIALLHSRTISFAISVTKSILTQVKMLTLMVKNGYFVKTASNGYMFIVRSKAGILTFKSY
jgi:hypothetical protein